MEIVSGAVEVANTDNELNEEDNLVLEPTPRHPSRVIELSRNIVPPPVEDNLRSNRPSVNQVITAQAG